MDLLKVLAMPFQMASVMFVALSSLLLAWSTSLGGTFLVLGIFQYWLMLLWLVNYALRLIDDAANGVREAAAASYEMLANPFLDLRGMVHPVLAGAAGITYWIKPEWPVAPALVAAALLFPASIGACAMSGRTRDALNPAAMWNVVRGLGPWYLVLMALVAGCAFAGVLLVRGTVFSAIGSRALMFFVLQMLVLVVYAGIGGTLYLRRLQLGFEPRISPERKEQQLHNERVRHRQAFLDGLYHDVRVRQAARATSKVSDWLAAQPTDALAGDLAALLEAGREWNEPREFPRLLRGLLPVLLKLRQPALAMNAAAAGLSASASFSPADEATAVALVSYALQTGRRRAAAQLLDNYLNSEGAKGEPGPQLKALTQALRPQDTPA